MARAKLTAGSVREFSTDKAQAFLWDSEAPGLAVRATRSGAKAYIFQGKWNGKDVRITIGDVKTRGIDEARAKARHLQTLIDDGRDPREEKRERIASDEAKREQARRKGITVGEAWGAYIEARRHKWSARHLQDHAKLSREGGTERKRGQGMTEAGPLTGLMPLRLSELTAEHVARWLDTETSKRPTQAALAYRLLRAFLRWCAGMPEYQAAAHLEAVGSRMSKDHLPKSRAKADDCLQREQLPAWFKAVRELGNPIIAAYLQTLLLTGARREELAALQWSDVDFQWRGLSISDKVEEAGRIIPLTPYVAAILAPLPRRKDRNGKPVPWVFSSPTAANGRLMEPRAAHTRALAAAGLPHVSIHGLRRSFGTLAEWVEAPTGVVAQIMGHKPSALAEKHYRRRPLDLLRMWHSRIEAWILEQAGLEQPEAGQQGLRLVEGGKP